MQHKYLTHSTFFCLNIQLSGETSGVFWQIEKKNFAKNGEPKKKRKNCKLYHRPIGQNERVSLVPSTRTLSFGVEQQQHEKKTEFFFFVRLPSSAYNVNVMQAKVAECKINARYSSEAQKKKNIEREAIMYPVDGELKKKWKKIKKYDRQTLTK